jgi:threonine dehydratase
MPDDAADPICIVLSGGNIDLMFLGKVVSHGLEASGRFARYSVLVPDQPGNLALVLQTVAGAGGNVLHVQHRREGFGLSFGTVEIEIAVETRDADHAARIAQALQPYMS